MKLNSKVMLIAALGAVMFVSMPVTAKALTLGAQGGGQQDLSNKMVDSLNLQDVDVRDALRALFKYANGTSYVVQPEVQGTVTISLSNVKFELALRNILDQVKATFRIEGGIYQIIARKEDTGTTPDNPNPQPVPAANNQPVRIPLNHADPYLVFMLLRGMSASQPETSTLISGGMFGGQNGGGQNGNNGFGGGNNGFGGGGK